MKLITPVASAQVNKHHRLKLSLIAIVSLTWSSFIGLCVMLGLPILGLMLSREKSQEINDFLTEHNMNYLLDHLIQTDLVSTGIMSGFAYGLFSLLGRHRELFIRLRQRRFNKLMAGQGVGAAHSTSGEDTAP